MAIRRTQPINIVSTWDDAEKAFKSFAIDIATSGFAGGNAASRPFEIRVDGTAVFAINSAGNITVGGGAQAGVTASGATLAVSAALHGGRTVILTKTDGQAVTLPAATGSGVKYEFVIGAAVASVGTTIKVTGDDIMQGTAYGDDGDGEPANAWVTASDSDTITMLGDTNGGKVGDRWIIQDIAADKWAVIGFLSQGGTEVTPFSATVT